MNNTVRLQTTRGGVRKTVCKRSAKMFSRMRRVFLRKAYLVLVLENKSVSEVTGISAGLKVSGRTFGGVTQGSNG